MERNVVIHSLVQNIGRHPRLWILVFCLAGSLATFGPSLGNAYVMDDIPAIVENPAAAWPPQLDLIFGTNYWGNRPLYENLTIYRPLATLSFSFVDAFCSSPADDAMAQRLVNLLLNGVVAWLLGLIIFALTSRFGLSLAAAMLFCVHPVHVEAVIAVVSRAELMTAGFVLAGVLVHLGWYRSDKLSPGVRAAVGFLIFGLALMSKENGATLMIGLVLMDLAVFISSRVQRTNIKPGPWWIHVGNFSIFAAYMFLRSQILSGMLSGALAYADNPILGAGTLARVLTPFKVLYLNLGLMVFPVDLTWDYSFNHIQVVQSAFDPGFLVGALGFACLLTGMVYGLRRRTNLALALALFAATYSVASNFAFLSTILMAERLLYLPSAFFLMALVLGLAEVNFLSARWLQVGLGLLLVLAVVRVQVRVPDWEDQLSLAKSGVLVAPMSSKSQIYYGNQLQAAGNFEEGVKHLNAATIIDPTNFIAHTNLGIGLSELGRLDLAVEHWAQATELTKGRYFRSCARLCNGAMELGRIDLLRSWCTKPCIGAPANSTSTAAGPVRSD
jgi:protein O-mannosyl-transferase